MIDVANLPMKLGKAEAKKDSRNLRLSAIIKVIPKVPLEYDFDVQHPSIPTPMYANDVYGDCVIAGRAHQTLRFELVEQSKILNITDKEVLKEYFKQTGGVDSGLYLLDSISLWRKLGWVADKKRYWIKAFAEVNPKSKAEIKASIYTDLGIGLGLYLPASAARQLQLGQTWSVVAGSSSKPGSWGGHYVYVTGYTKSGPVCVTWGRKQSMTWGFLAKYCDEAYAIIDAINTTKKRKLIDEKAVNSFLDTVSKPKER